MFGFISPVTVVVGGYFAQAVLCWFGGWALRLHWSKTTLQVPRLWGWGWVALGCYHLLGGLLVLSVLVIPPGHPARTTLSVVATDFALVGAVLFLSGLRVLQTGHPITRKRLTQAIGATIILAVTLTLVTVNATSQVRMFLRVSISREFLSGLAFLALAVGALRYSDGVRLHYRLPFVLGTGLYGLNLLHYFAVDAWNFTGFPIDTRYRYALAPLELLLQAVAAVGMLIWTLGEEERIREKVEAELQQTRKLEALGMLAGGIAHEMNNLSQVIVAGADIVGRRLPNAEEGTSAPHEALRMIRDASDRAHSMASSLLEYSRNAPGIEGASGSEARADVGQVLAANERMLRHVLPRSITLRTPTVTEEVVVPVPDVDLRQVILNLCINARDAMPDGGLLTIELMTKQGHAPCPVVLEVTDTGSGMSPEVQRRAFEPFFTTKGPERGTGLGLASVHGIVTSAGGSVEIESEEGQGTCFRISLPRAR